MNMSKRIVLLSLSFLCLTATAWAMGNNSNDGYTQAFENGNVNWESGVVTATGIGAPPANAVNMAQARALARRAAIVVARRNLLEIIKGVQIDSETTVKEYMVSSDVIRSSISGYLHNSQILDVAYMSDGSVEATVGVNLRGGLAKIILPKTMPFKTVERQAPMTPQPSYPAPAQQAPAAPQQSLPGQIFTGLVIDASGTGARPAMSPKIYDEAGNEVYGSALVSREYAIQQGMAGYAKDMEKAKARPRVTDKPLVVKAISAKGKGMSDLVISGADANRLRELAENQSFLEKCRVMIVLN